MVSRLVRRRLSAYVAISALALASGAMAAAPSGPLEGLGPYNAAFLSGGIGIDRDLADSPLLTAQGSATFSAWVNTRDTGGTVTLIALGNLAGPTRSLALVDGRPALISGKGAVLIAPAALTKGQWTHVAATLSPDGARIYVDGRPVASGTLSVPAVAGQIHIAPVIPGQPHFSGTLTEAHITPRVATPEALAAYAGRRPDFDTVQTWHVGVGWEFQKYANTGYWRQQDAWTLPQGLSLIHI